MGFSIVPLLVHSDSVPESARDYLRAAQAAPPADRVLALRSAARALNREAGLDCADALEIVGLSGGCSSH